MWIDLTTGRLRAIVILGAVLTYLVVFPGDLAVILSPLEAILSLSQSIATGLYVLLGVGLVCWTVVIVARAWKRPSASG